MKQLSQAITVIAIIGLTVFFACKKKDSSSDPDNSTTTSSTTGSTTSGTTTGGTTTGSTPSCTLNPKQVICSNYLPSTTLSSGIKGYNGTCYEVYSYTGNNYAFIYFNGSTAPATGTYNIVPNFPPINTPGVGQASVRILQNGTVPANGYGQSGVVYVTNTGTNITATYCSVPLSIEFNGNTYTATASANVEGQ